jgi:hypothetical protein
MAASSADSHPWPIYNARYRVVFPIFDADGDLVTAAAGLDSELSQDQGTFADATNEATEIATSSGMYYLDLIATELDTKSTAIIVKTSTSGAKTTPLVLYPKRLPVVRTGTAQAGANTTITLDSGASAIDDFYNGCYVNITNNSPSNALGQARRITDYVGSTKVATVEAAWGTNPSSASTFEILAPGDTSNVVQWAGTQVMEPTAAGRPTVDVKKVNGTDQTAGDLATLITAVDDYVDTEVAAIKAQTDKLTFTASNEVSANVTVMAANVVTASAIATDAIGSAELAASAITEIQSGLSTLDAAGVRSAVGLASANLDTQLTTIDDFLDTEIAAIKAKTDNLPSDPADASDIASSFTTVNTKLDTIDDFLDTEIAAIKAKTDNLPSDPADASDIASSFSTVNTKLDAIDDFVDTEVASILAAVDTEVAAIKAKTDNLPTDPADASDIASSFTTVNSKLDAIDDYVDSEVAAIKGVTDKLDTAMELDGAEYRFTINALEQGPSGGGGGASASAIADAVWDEARSGHTTDGTFGKYLDEQVSLVGSVAIQGKGTSKAQAKDIAEKVWEVSLGDRSAKDVLLAKSEFDPTKDTVLVDSSDLQTAISNVLVKLEAIKPDERHGELLDLIKSLEPKDYDNALKSLQTTISALEAKITSITPEVDTFSPTALQSVYGNRQDLQALYNPDGTAKNPADPKVAGIPTLQDWATKYGSKEEPALQQNTINALPTSNVAGNQLVDTVNEKLKALLSADGQLTPDEQALLDQVKGLSNKELPLLATARSAADDKNYKELDALMGQIKTLRSDRTALTAKLLENLNMSEAERAYSDRLRGQVQGARKEQVNIESQAIPMFRIQGQQLTATKRAALEQMVTAENLQALTAQRQTTLDTLKTALQINSEDISTTLNLEQEFRSIAKEQRDQARQDIADMMEFSQGRSFNELDSDSQQRLVLATANTPLTLGMVQNALGATNRKFAQDNKITNPFYFAPDGRTVINTKTGEAYTNEQDFFRAGGAKDFSNVATVQAQAGQAVKFETVTLGSGKTARKVRYGYDAKGNIVSAVDLATGQSVATNTSAGNTNVTIPRSTSMPSTTPKSTKITVTEGTNYADAYLTPRRGPTDGYVSPEDYKTARDAWVQDGLPVSTFDSKFAKYINPADPQDYPGSKVKK